MNRIKTKIRRLYDIANILAALGLVAKTHIWPSHKPGFAWLGYQPDAAPWNLEPGCAAKHFCRSTGAKPTGAKAQKHGPDGAVTVTVR